MMEKLFARLYDWIKVNYPEGLEVLNPPATDGDIKELEGVLGFSLPEGLARVLKIHNGENGKKTTGVFPDGGLLSTKDIAVAWEIWKKIVDEGTFKDTFSEPEKGIKNYWWNIKWIPITSDGAGNHNCVDTDPDKGGTYGQVISMDHEIDERYLWAKSLTEWISDFVSDLEKGEAVYSKEHGGIVRKDNI